MDLFLTTSPHVAPSFLALLASLAPLAAHRPAALAGPPATDPPARAQKVLHLPMRTAGPGSLDPVRGSTVYDNRAISNVYETLLQYKYLARPLQLEPLLAARMPEVSKDGKTYRFELKPGVLFQDDPCFPDGVGRELVAADVFYSWKRMADPRNEPRGWWLFENTIVGFDEYHAAQGAALDAGGEFDYDAPVAGMRVLGEHELEIELKEPVYRFVWILAMFQTAVVPREAAETYGTRLSRHPVGTGPFTMAEEDWVINKSMVFRRNPKFRGQRYPSEWEAADEEQGLHLAAGKPMPFVDRVEITMWPVEQGMWLNFRQGKLDYTQVPDENFSEAIRKRRHALRDEFADQGVVLRAIPLLDFIFHGFNMEDEVVGGYTQEKKWLRQAIALAIDLEEFNDTFYSGTNVVYDGMIPPGLDGYPQDGKGPVSYIGPDLERARELLAMAGYPGGEGLPTIEYYSSASGNIPQQTELLKRQLGKIGIDLNVRLLDFPQLIQAITLKKAPFYAYAWSSDYPDGENNLALFYGPNKTPGSNRFNYQRPEFDALYERIRVMAPSAERTKLYEKMRDMVIEDCPYIGSMARTRNYLINPWLVNFKPTEDFGNWVKYLDLDESKRR